MDREQSLGVLGLSPSAPLEDIKRAFRTLAFRYHPDLHPEDPDASRKFQRLNEAYVTACRFASSAPGPGAGPDREAWTDAASGASDRARERHQTRGAHEEVLKDILSDPFARQVFEDIYSTLRRQGQTGTAYEASPGGQREAEVRVRQIQPPRPAGLWSLVKGWLKGQLDDEQTVTLAPSDIRPGRTIRFQVSRRFSGPPATIEVTLPRDYVVGRPVRLKGYGRRLGPWQGDLYLRFLPG